jgi:hypothetical protein
MPERYVIDLMGLEGDSDCRFWKDEKNSVVMASQIWCHYDEAKHYESSNPECGGRIQASLEFVTAMLAKFSRDLIIEVQIDRRRYRPYQKRSEDDEERVPTQARLYLLGSDGQFRTL